MYISRLRITNFRTFGEPAFEIALKPFTLILGENNIGKTNLVSAVTLLFGQDISVQQRRTLELDDINYQAVQGVKKQVADNGRKASDVEFPEVLIEATLSDLNEEQHSIVGDWYSDNTLDIALVTYRFSLRATFDRERWIALQREMLKKEMKRAHPELAVDFPINEYRFSIFGGGIPSNECDSQYLRMLRVEFLDALRDANRELIAGGEQRLLYRILNQEHDNRYGDLKSSLLAVEDAVTTNSALGDLKTEVTTLLERVSLATRADDNAVAFQFSAPDAAELLKKIGLVYGTDPITVARNGLGRNNLLYVALVISQIARIEEADASNDNYVCFRCVGIEEPEAHLHPHLQDHLASNIEGIRAEHSERLQLLLTSHSTHLAAKLSLENTVIVFSDDDGSLQSHYVLDGIDPVKEKDSIRFLSLYLDATKSRLLFARSIILVEGIAEQTVVPALFRKAYGRTLESVGCSVVNVHGVAFKHFLRVFQNGLFKRCVVITDSDSETTSKERAEALKTEYDDGKMISVQISKFSTFEKDLIDANRSGNGKKILMEALVATRPVNGKAFKKATGAKKIDVETCFHEIEEYKAEFAFNLVGRSKASEAALSVPDYVSEAFRFVMQEASQ